MWRGLDHCGRLRLLASAEHFTGKSVKLLGVAKDAALRGVLRPCPVTVDSVRRAPRVHTHVLARSAAFRSRPTRANALAAAQPSRHCALCLSTECGPRRSVT